MKLIWGILFFLSMTFLVSTTYAQTACQRNNRATDLITAPQPVGGIFGNQSGTCITSNQAAFPSFKIPTFEELKKLYYDNAKPSTLVTKNPVIYGGNQANIPFTAGSGQLYYVNGPLNLDGNVAGSSSGVVFVQGNLYITQNYTYGTAETGSVFIVKGNIYIYNTVTRVDAALISAGTIYTGSPGGAPCTSSSVKSSSLVVNGTLVALTDGQPIKFCRKKIDNTQPAELVNSQAKYLVILKNIMSQPVEIVAEDVNFAANISSCSAAWGSCVPNNPKACGTNVPGTQTRTCSVDQTGETSRTCTIPKITCKNPLQIFEGFAERFQVLDNYGLVD